MSRRYRRNTKQAKAKTPSLPPINDHVPLLQKLTFVDLLDIPIPSYQKPEARWEFVLWFQQADKLICQTIEALMGPNRQVVLSSFMSHYHKHGQTCITIQQTLIQNFSSMRIIVSTGAGAGSSLAIVVGAIWLKYTYLLLLAKSIHDTFAKSKRRELLRKSGFRLPFLHKEDLSVFELPGQGIDDLSNDEMIEDGDTFAVRSLTADESNQKHALCAPEIYSIKTAQRYPSVFLSGVLLFPMQKLGTYTQWQVYQQLSTLADAWHRLRFKNAEILELLSSLTAVLAEYECMTFSNTDLRLDMGSHYSTYTLMEGIDEITIKGDQRLVIGEEGARVEPTSEAKEMKRSIRLEQYTLCTSSRFKGETLGMLIPMITQARLINQLSTSKTHHIDAETFLESYAQKAAGVLIRHLGTHTLEVIEGVTAIPMIFTQTTSPSIFTLVEDYNDLWINLFQKESQTKIEQTTLESVAYECRMTVLPFGIQEQYAYTHNFDWPYNIEDTENDCVARMTHNDRLQNWIYRSFAEYTYDVSPVDQAQFLAKLINSLCYLHMYSDTNPDAQPEDNPDIYTDTIEWSRRAFYFTKHLTIDEITTTIERRDLPFIMFLAGEVFFVHRRRTTKIQNLMHAIAVWFTTVEIDHDCQTRDTHGRICKLTYVRPFLAELVNSLVLSKLKMYQQVIEAYFHQRDDSSDESSSSWSSSSDTESSDGGEE